MSEKTNISWATSTGNPWLGCTKVSPGCAHCYAAELDASRFSKTMGGGTKEHPISHWGKGAPRVRTKSFWTDAVKWNEQAKTYPWLCACDLNDPYAGRISCPKCGESGFPNRPRIFPSLCDWLDDEVPIEWLADFLQLIHDTPNLDWLLLTKRPENWNDRIQRAWRDVRNRLAGDWNLDMDTEEWLKGENPPANVWLGVSVEDQKRADERIPLLLKIPAKVRFLSVEPLLEEVSLFHRLTEFKFKFCEGASVSSVRDRINSMPWIDWVIVGGESGAGRRDCGVRAITNIAEQCKSLNIPAFVKQDSAFKPGQQGRIPDEIWKLKQFPQL